MKGTIHSLKRRIKSIRSTGQMTNAMKTVAISKYNRTLAALQLFTPYYDACSALLAEVGFAPNGNEIKRGNKICFVVLTANRGLCGTYNNDVFKKLSEVIPPDGNYCVVICGRWGQNSYKSKQIQNVIKCFDIPDIPDYGSASALAAYLQGLYESDTEIGSVRFVMQEFINIMTQIPTENEYLPPAVLDTAAQTEYVFDPDKAQLSQGLQTRCLNAAVYKYLLSSAVGAHGAMFVAMRTSAENSEEMLNNLELELNRMRQTAVTTQVIEIASGNIAALNTEGEN